VVPIVSDTDTEKKPLVLIVPEQGIDEHFSPTQAIEFFQREAEFYQKLKQLLDSTNTALFNVGLGQTEICGAALQTFQSIKTAIVDGDPAVLDQYEKDARSMVLIVGQGWLGKIITKCIAEGDGENARWLTILYCRKWSSETVNRHAAPLRALLVGNPLYQGIADVTATAEALKQSSASRSVSADSKRDLDAFIDEKRTQIETLADLYRTQLTLEKPAKHWEKIAKRKAIAWRLWLVFFAALSVAPLGVIWSYAGAITVFVKSVSTTENGGISLAGLAVISAPALFYAWFLKNISRVYIQTLGIADDAAHRNALAITYLGLVENEKVSITDQERAIIMNALFRPVPSQGIDDGPPSGLMELIKGDKKSG
jgi:Family of unknown function (DUF6161)